MADVIVIMVGKETIVHNKLVLCIIANLVMLMANVLTLLVYVIRIIMGIHVKLNNVRLIAMIKECVMKVFVIVIANIQASCVKW
jgi:hypothetical protein